MIKAAIVGATGYTGSELVRFLHPHPHVSIEAITSESRKGERFSDVHPHFQGIVDMKLHSADAIGGLELDLVFLGLPHGISMNYVSRFNKNAFKIIDLSGDYRLSSPGVYESWYQKKHIDPSGFDQAVYGLPELHRQKVGEARLVANPGCYPTSAILGLAPLLKEGLVRRDQIIIDSKSGITGAGIKAKPTTHYSNVSDNFKSYGLKTHRHTIEIEEQLSAVAGADVSVQFTPHLLPVDRGILSTIYTHPKGPTNESALRKLYSDFYESHPFVRLREDPPSLKDVRGSNFCDLFVTHDDRTNRIITIAVIDNLVKGAAGQAVQNMNLMFGCEESAGLKAVSLNP